MAVTTVGAGRRIAVGALVLGALVILGQLVLAGPASAHAELLSTSPRNGQRLATPPTQVTLTFSEKVGIVSGGLRLIDTDTGDDVETPQARSVGDTVVWPMPADLPDGRYLVNWRMISADSHPVAGAFSFGVGASAAPVVDETTATGAPWQLSVTRWLGYLAFAMVAGVVALACVCWPAGRRERRMDVLLRSGMVAAVATTALLLLLQGPYEAGVSYLRLFDPDLLSLVAHSDFGPWIELRALLFLALAALLWDWGALENAFNRWAAAVALLAAAVTFSGTGHAAASGHLLDRAVDTLHVLGASVWVGGLVVLAAISLSGPAVSRPDAAAIGRFSRLALTSVVVVVASGTVNAVLRLSAWSQLWDSRYGVLLSAKILLVAGVLGVASFSRRAVGRGEPPWKPVRVEAVGVAAVLAVTSVLTFTAPPATVASGQNDNATVDIDLGQGRQAEVTVAGTSTSGSKILVAVTGEKENSVSLRATYPERDVGPLNVPLRRTPRGWAGPFQFTFAGEWTLTVTVEFPHLDAPVGKGTVNIQ
jgi:copper transport protein